MKAKMFTDGGARGNPGPAGIGVVIEGQHPGEISEYIGKATNNIAEYKALIRGLQKAHQLGYKELEILCDSQLVVEQVKGNYKVKEPHLKPLREQVSALILEFENVSIKHIPREQNEEADKLVNQAIDAAVDR
jgi:ribonuclease HI